MKPDRRTHRWLGAAAALALVGPGLGSMGALPAHATDTISLTCGEMNQSLRLDTDRFQTSLLIPYTATGANGATFKHYLHYSEDLATADGTRLVSNGLTPPYEIHVQDPESGETFASADLAGCPSTPERLAVPNYPTSQYGDWLVPPSNDIVSWRLDDAGRLAAVTTVPHWFGALGVPGDIGASPIDATVVDYGHAPGSIDGASVLAFHCSSGMGDAPPPGVVVSSPELRDGFTLEQALRDGVWTSLELAAYGDGPGPLADLEPSFWSLSPTETWGVWDDHPELGPVSWRIVDPETGRVLGQSTHTSLCGTDFDPIDMEVVSLPTPTKDEAGRWVVPDDDPTYQWLLEADGELAVRVLPALTTFPDGEVTHNFGLPEEPAPDPAPVVDRVQGEDRYATAANLVLADYAPGPNTVYVASGRQFPDALAGAALAGAQDVPVLLTRPDLLPDATRAALQTLAPQHVVVLGGPDAVDEAVLDEVTALGLDATRLFGSNRYATAAAVSAQLSPADSAFVASGLGYPDALAGAGAAGAVAAPVLLTRQDTLPALAAAELVRHQPDTVYVLGGTTAVSDSVVEQIEALGLTVVRVGGTDRYGTAAAVAALQGEAGFPHAWVASGRGFADALSAAPLAGRDEGAILLTRPGSLPQATGDALLAGSPGQVTVLGGEEAVSSTVEQAISDLAWQ